MLYSARSQRSRRFVVLAVILAIWSSNGLAADSLRVGIAQADITPPVGFPIVSITRVEVATITASNSTELLPVPGVKFTTGRCVDES